MNDIFLKRTDIIDDEMVLFVGDERPLYTHGDTYRIMGAEYYRTDMYRVYIMDDENSVSDPWIWDAEELFSKDLFVPMSKLSEEDKFAYKLGGIEALEIQFDSKD